MVERISAELKSFRDGFLGAELTAVLKVCCVLYLV